MIESEISVYRSPLVQIKEFLEKAKKERENIGMSCSVMKD